MEYKGGACYEKIECKDPAPECGSAEVKAYPVRERVIQGQNIGDKRLYLKMLVHRLYCRKCQAMSYENPISSPPQGSHDRAPCCSILELRDTMTISAIAAHFDLDWEAVKNVEVSWLEKEYSHIHMKGIRIIGIDEIHVGHERVEGKRRQKYLTVVRNMLNGAVLFVGDGKGSEALAPFKARLNHFKADVEAVCMDMSNAYAKWVREQLPNATVVYDHFHVIQLMNQKLDKVRRKVQSELDQEATKQLKGKRWALLHNSDDLTDDEKLSIEALQQVSKDLYDAWTLKECLVKIYQLARRCRRGSTDADRLVRHLPANEHPEAQDHGKDGGTASGRYLCLLAVRRLTNAATEGFNNKSDI